MTPDSESGASEEAAEATPQQPLLRIVSGNPTPEELAALVTVIAAAASSATVEEDESDLSGWGAPVNMHRAPMPTPGPGAWAQLGRR